MHMQAVERINQEMQKNPTDKYMEIIGQYIIDRCANDDDGAKVAEAGKTLAGAMGAVLEKAKSSKRGNVAVLLPEEVFAAVDRYFGFKADRTAQERAMMVACGGNHTSQVRTSREMGSTDRRVSLDLADFL